VKILVQDGKGHLLSFFEEVIQANGRGYFVFR
jgi:hypothetical protein